ncbi:hypothetical protein T265_02606 [Opisthorchis viverrini]|uniref:ubiquitinyl hydrolase 1 n=1 Tax=Opisthorchis viverrini TaxID=6198 RepID=A0A074ZV72_OPIVI|nr:hypothetical protein T265_02606 [Opisthorchis viverrini]KER31041.1 hypothetical protein T265_02606 [Opisthorchis viverrini]
MVEDKVLRKWRPGAMVSRAEGGRSSGGGSGASSDSESSEAHIDYLVDDIIGKLSIYPAYSSEAMTIKNRKDRPKPDRQTEWEGAEVCPTHSRHGHGYKPYAFPEERKEAIVHRSRVRPSHQMESTLPDSTTYPPAPHFNRTQLRVAAQQPEALGNSFEFRGASREPTSTPVLSPIPDKENGNNSEDEYYAAAHSDDTNLEKLLVEKKGWKIIKVQADGACLFRSVCMLFCYNDYAPILAHQIFGDEEKHDVVRNQVIDYMLKNKEHFSAYVTEDFEHYINRKRDITCYGNHIEIQAIAELYNRPVEIYYDSVEPINVFHADYSKEFPIRLSYHGRVHYNSIVDPFNPSFGYGLGMPNYQPSLAEPDLIAKAINESEATQLEETMLRDKLAETEHSELERCIEAQVIRESYYDYLRQLQLPMRHNVGGPSSQLPLGALASAVRTSAVDVASSSTTSTWAPVRLPTQSLPSPPLPSSSSHYQLPSNLSRMDEDSLVAMVMEQSRHEYLESLRKRCASPSSDTQEPHTPTSSADTKKSASSVQSTLPSNSERS